MTLGGIFINSNATSFTAMQDMSQISPILIGAHGSVRFPERSPNPDTVYQIQKAVQYDDFETLNAILVKHRFYVLPERMRKVN